MKFRVIQRAVKACSVLALLLCVLHAPATPAVAGGKKLIELGYDAPDTLFMRNNIATMKLEPFDGVVFTARPNWGTNQEFTWGAWGNNVFSRASMQHAVNELQATDFGHYRENFLRFNVTPGNVDWFDNFDSILSNVGTAAWLVQQGGARGIFFDTEDYETALWHYPSQTKKSTKTFSAYAAQIRLRGQQVMTAMQAEAPNLTLLIPVAYSYVWGPSQINGNLTQLSNVEYGLLPFFLDGMLDAAGPGIRFVDGFENSYGYNTLAQFQEARNRIVSGTLPIVANDTAYAEKFDVGFAAWMDAFWRTQGWHSDPSEFHLNYYTPEELESVLTSALTTSDEYVWLYSEQLFWRRSNTAGSPDIPAAYDAAVRAAIASASVAGDFDHDGDVDGADFVAWQTNFPKASGAIRFQGDADGDGDVDGADFVIWQTTFPFAPNPAAVPEPHAAMLLGGGLLAAAYSSCRRSSSNQVRNQSEIEHFSKSLS